MTNSPVQGVLFGVLSEILSETPSQTPKLFRTSQSCCPYSCCPFILLPTFATCLWNVPSHELLQTNHCTRNSRTNAIVVSPLRALRRPNNYCGGTPCGIHRCPLSQLFKEGKRPPPPNFQPYKENGPFHERRIRPY